MLAAFHASPVNHTKPVVEFEVAVARPDDARQNARRPRFSPVDKTAAAAPSVNDEHINRVMGPATAVESSTSSAVTSDWNCARGFEGSQPTRLHGRLGHLSEGRPTFGELVP